MRRAASLWVCTRGLRFGLVQHPQGAPEVYVEGALRRSTPLARDVHGPRAILNAVERLIGSAAAERDKARRDLEIAQGQLRDYEARLGAGFPHATYLEALTAPAHPARGRAVQHDARGGRGGAAHGGRPCRTPQGPACRPYGRSRSRAVRPTPHGDRRRGHHHAHSPARAGRDRAPARRQAVPGGSCNALHRRLSPRRLRPRRPRHARHPGSLHSSCACSRDGQGVLDGALLPPSPRGLRGSLALLSVAWLRHPAGAVAALAHRPGLPPTAREAARVGTRDGPACACPLRLLLPPSKARNVMLWAPASRPAPSAALRVGLRPALTPALPHWLRGERRDHQQTCTGPVAQTTGRSRSASFTSP